MSVGQRLMLLATVVVVAVLAASLWVAGSPAAQRDARLDQRRINDLKRLDRAVDAYWVKNQSLPPDLATLARVPGQALPKDPAGGPAYAYEVAGARSYRLCATFATDTAARQARRAQLDEAWLHAVGRHCFDRRIDESDR